METLHAMLSALPFQILGIHVEGCRALLEAMRKIAWERPDPVPLSIDLTDSSESPRLVLNSLSATPEFLVCYNVGRAPLHRTFGLASQVEVLDESNDEMPQHRAWEAYGGAQLVTAGQKLLSVSQAAARRVQEKAATRKES
jgi:hypothetical protein